MGTPLHATPDEAAEVVGFLAAVESHPHGLFGGYLLVDEIGRPLEFHCTTPVRVSRAQQILYGATLEGHLHGRQIGGPLLAASSLAPRIVLVDSKAMMHVKEATPLPVALVEPGGQQRLREAHGDLLPAIDLAEPFERIRAAIHEAQRHG